MLIIPIFADCGCAWTRSKSLFMIIILLKFRRIDWCKKKKNTWKSMKVRSFFIDSRWFQWMFRVHIDFLSMIIISMKWNVMDNFRLVGHCMHWPISAVLWLRVLRVWMCFFFRFSWLWIECADIMLHSAQHTHIHINTSKFETFNYSPFTLHGKNGASSQSQIKNYLWFTVNVRIIASIHTRSNLQAKIVRESENLINLKWIQ